MECDFCKEGRHNMCFANKNTPGKSTAATSGAFAEYFLAKPYLVRKIPDTLTDIEALMLAPAATAYNMVSAMNVKKGDKVLISGGGVMGALVSAWCKYFGAKFIGIIETSRHRALSLMDFGHTTQVFDGNDKDPIEGAYKGISGFNVHFECSGVSNYINTAILTLRRGSSIALLGTQIKSAPIN
jgi:(R,R)-butanediol dehydrogenase/meso-butanediol dehydrogenase/diacetyl reductase